MPRSEIYTIGQIPKAAESPMTGLRYWRNQFNKAFLLRVHYRADPEKRKDEWKKAAQVGVEKKAWEREYEINFTVPEGNPVFEDEFDFEWHVSPKPLIYDPKYPLILGWDFGYSPACVITQFYPDTRWHVLEEKWSLRAGLERFAEEVLFSIQIDYPRSKVISYLDPAGMKPMGLKGKDETSCLETLEAVGFAKSGWDIRPGIQTWETRRKSVALMLKRAVKRGQAAVQIDPSCSMLIQGFRGGYHYPERVAGKRLTKIMQTPVKNEYSHVHDALQYPATGVIRLAQTRSDYDEYDAWDEEVQVGGKSTWAL
jgi:hypothetical protein